MSELDNVERKLRELAKDASSPDALDIISKLSAYIDTLRADLIFQQLENPQNLSDVQTRDFQTRVYEELKTQRVTDLAVSYNAEWFADYSPAVRFAIAQALLQIAKEQSFDKVPNIWAFLRDSNGHM